MSWRMFWPVSLLFPGYVLAYVLAIGTLSLNIAMAISWLCPGLRPALCLGLCPGHWNIVTLNVVLALSWLMSWPLEPCDFERYHGSVLPMSWPGRWL
jgi:hypothetical protein